MFFLSFLMLQYQLINIVLYNKKTNFYFKVFMLSKREQVKIARVEKVVRRINFERRQACGNKIA